MAISNSDYKQIHSTLSNITTAQSNGNLSIGNYVINLLPALESSSKIEQVSKNNGSYTIIKDQWYQYPNDVTSGAISGVVNGELYYTIDLKPDVNYMIQVINNTQCFSLDDKLTEGNNSLKCKISDTEIIDIQFNNTLYFRIPQRLDEQSVECTLSIVGVSPAVDNSNHSWITTQIPSIFLFATPLPWIVDNDGQIINMLHEPLLILTQRSDTIAKPKITNEKLRQFFAAPPAFKENGELKPIDNLPNYIDADYSESFIENIVLVPMRDYLVTKEHDWNKKTVRNRYGILRHISNLPAANYNPMDNIRPEVLIQNPLKLHVTPAFHLLQGNTFKWEQAPWTNTSNFANKTYSPFSKYMISCLGYNYNMPMNDDYYKYTSIAFAWGIYSETSTGAKIELLSAPSIPFIVDRRIANCSYVNANQEWILGWNNPEYSFIHKNATNYYSSPAFYIDYKNV